MGYSKKTWVGVACTTLFYLFAESASAALMQPSFQGFPSLPGQTMTRAFAISADGSAVVGYGQYNAKPAAVRWSTREGIVGLTTGPGMSNAIAQSVSSDGSVIVGRVYAPAPELPAGWADRAFRWTAATGMVLLETPPGATNHYATAISNDGRVTVGYAHDTKAGQMALRWTADGKVRVLGSLGSSTGFTFADGVSADGSVVVGTSNQQMFRWTEAQGMVRIGSGGAYDASDDGSAIVGSTGRWTPTTGLKPIGGWANAVSGDGTIVVGWTNWRDEQNNLVQDAFIWDPVNGNRRLKDVLANDYNLDLTGWSLGEATDISADGRVIIGYGKNPTGSSASWLAIIPEPSTLTLLGLGAIVLLRRRTP